MFVRQASIACFDAKPADGWVGLPASFSTSTAANHTNLGYLLRFRSQARGQDVRKRRLKSPSALFGLVRLMGIG